MAKVKLFSQNIWLISKKYLLLHSLSESNQAEESKTQRILTTSDFRQDFQGRMGEWLKPAVC